MRSFVILTPMLFLTLSACLEDGVPDPPVEVRFQLTNTNGEPTTVFQEGEDILFDYRVINNTDEPIFWQMENLGFHDGIFLVFRSLENGDLIEMGSPFKNPKISVSGLGVKIEARRESIIRVTWLGNWDRSLMLNALLGELYDNNGIMPFEYSNNSALPRGKYFVEFEHELRFPGHDNLQVYQKVFFEVR